MMDKAIYSILIGGFLSVVAFIPYLIFQYRRYGRFSAARLMWTVVLLVYGTAIAAYTLFPLPTAETCASHAGYLELDPWVYFRQIWHDHLAGESWTSLATSWTVMQMVWNVVLFIPLGVILRHQWNLGWVRATVAGLGLSLLIETTQLTGNWFTADCRYRVADVNDLMTNTAGALIGSLLSLLIPDFTVDADELTATRGYAKPITRGRRLTGMFFDLVALGVVGLGSQIAGVIGYWVIVGTQTEDQEAAAIANGIILAISAACCLLVVAGFALVGSGASLGQRLVYLKPVPTRTHPRVWLVVRAASVQGLILIGLFLPGWAGPDVPYALFAAVLWTLLAVIWVLANPRGLSLTLAGCILADSRPSGPTPGSPARPQPDSEHEPLATAPSAPTAVTLPTQPAPLEPSLQQQTPQPDLVNGHSRP